MAKPLATFKISIPDTKDNGIAFDDMTDMIEAAEQIKNAIEDLGFESVVVSEF